MQRKAGCELEYQTLTALLIQLLPAFELLRSLRAAIILLIAFTLQLLHGAKLFTSVCQRNFLRSRYFEMWKLQGVRVLMSTSQQN